MSSANPKVHEPSMEEILASIRRIISDDQEGLNGPLSTGAAEPFDVAAGSAEHEDRQPEPARAIETESGDYNPTIRFPANSAVPISKREELHEALVTPIETANDASWEHRGDISPKEQPTNAGTLLSDAVSASLSDAFGRLEPNPQAAGPQTFEDVVKDMLRPMLKTWLDENLPPLVERLIQAEIERITRARR
jgi:uncharacterized protein